MIKKSERIEMPWKNGGGTTFEIERVPAKGESYKWRLSQALVTSDGPFSLFPDCDRWIAVWEGAGFQLGNRALAPLEPYRFHGEEAIHCSLISGAVTDIGLIFNRAHVEAEMQIVSGRVRLLSGTHYLIARKSWVYESQILEPGDTLKLEFTDEQSVHLPVNTLVVSINLRGGPK